MLALLWPFLAFSFVDLLTESDMIPTSLQPDGLFIIGEASRSVAPDTAELALFIITYGVTAMHAMNESAARVQYIGQAIVSAGIKPADVETTLAGVHALYQPVSPQVGQFQVGGADYPYQARLNIHGEAQPAVGYRVITCMKISLKELGRLGEVIDSCASVGAQLINGVSFRKHNETAVRRAVIEAAAKDARAKGEALAAALGRQLGDLVAIAEELNFPAKDAIGGFGGVLMLQTPGSTGGMVVLTGELIFSARLHVRFNLQ
jgi:uncharacterized protein